VWAGIRLSAAPQEEDGWIGMLEMLRRPVQHVGEEEESCNPCSEKPGQRTLEVWVPMNWNRVFGASHSAIPEVGGGRREKAHTEDDGAEGSIGCGPAGVAAGVGPGRGAGAAGFWGQGGEYLS